MRKILNPEQHGIIVELQGKVAALEAENAQLVQLNRELAKEPARLNDQLELACGRIRKLMSENERLEKALTGQNEYDQLWRSREDAAHAEVERIKAESARLAAVCQMAYEAFEWTRGQVQFEDRMNVALIELAKGADSTALRELLGPTVELLERADRELRRYLMDQPLMLSMREQAARLRAAMGKATP